VNLEQEDYGYTETRALVNREWPERTTVKMTTTLSSVTNGGMDTKENLLS